MFPGPEEQRDADGTGLDGAGGVAGDVRNEPEEGAGEGSDADEVGLGSATPAGIAEAVTEGLSHER